MRLPAYLKSTIKRLDSRGVSHIIVPLLAVVVAAAAGTATLVASHANPAPKTIATKTVKPPKTSLPKPGKLVLYNGAGVYNAARIQLEGTPSFQHKCSTNIGPGQPVTVSLNIKGGNSSSQAGIAGLSVPNAPKLLSCSAISGTGAYKVTFAQNKDFSKPTPAITVDIDPNFCTLVFPNHPELTNKVVFKNGKCQIPQNIADMPPKVNVVVNVKPAINALKNNFVGYIEVKAADGTGLTQAQCTGQITAQYVALSFPKHNTVSHNFPLKYTKPKTGPTYCVAKLTKFANLPYSLYTINGIQNGTAYFNPAQGGVQINLAAPPAKKQPAKKTPTTNNGAASAKTN